MKKINRTALAATLLILSLGSCKKYLDLNENPNGAVQPPIDGLLAHATNASALTTFRVADITAYYCQYLASPNAASDLDIYNNIDASTTWNFIYDLETDINDLRNLATSQGHTYYLGVADILQAYNLSLTTNLWGNVPFSEAFQGAKIITPKYDDAKTLYDSTIALVDAGIALLSDASSADALPGPPDFIHGGSTAAWIKTGHMLKARWLNQVSKTSDYSAAAVLTELASGYASSADDAQVTQFSDPSPWNGVAIANAGLDLDGWLSSYFVNATNGTTYGVMDPRLPLITNLTQYGDYRGTPNGAGRTGTGTDNQESVLTLDGWYSKTGAALQLVTYAEGKFIEAEADFRSGNTADAYAAYLGGIEAHMAKIGVLPADIAAYTSNPAVAVGASGLTLGLIMKEKYVACFLLPVTWDDMRRTDYAYKDFTMPVGSALGQFIRRVNYPAVEISTNSGNVPTVNLTDHLWWDQ